MRNGKKKKPQNYSKQGLGKFVVMHVIKLNSWHDAMDLTDLLKGVAIVSYSGETALVQFYWPKYKPAEVNDIINQAINEFMKRCDRLEFHNTKYPLL